MFGKEETHTLHNSQKILKDHYAWYKKEAKKINPDKKSAIEKIMEDLDQAILEKKKKEASDLAKKLETECRFIYRRGFFYHAIHTVLYFALILALAIILRQIWFEPLQIPTGSMRPTFKETDHLLVTKTAFGINVPLIAKHLHFDSDSLTRGGFVIFSGDNLDIPDNDTLYFWLFPQKKQYIKRLIGKPGDTLYFYGGLIYGIDKEGKELVELLDSPYINDIDHVPFMDFEGRIKRVADPKTARTQIVLSQLGQAIGRYDISHVGKVQADIYQEKEWVPEQPHKGNPSKILSYNDFWGFRNFAMARLLTKQQVKEIHKTDPSTLGDGVLYLELRHNPSLSWPAPKFFTDHVGRISFLLNPYVSLLPLKQKDLHTLMENMYTARFVVKNGRVQRYAADGDTYSSASPSLAFVPDGTYEFYHGKAYKIGFRGWATELTHDHPIYREDPETVQKYFNLGIHWLNFFVPTSENQTAFPYRYAYFRKGALYLLGAPLLQKGDPAIKAFVENEEKKELESPDQTPYLAFKDHGPPLLADGKIDADFIRTFGVQVPEKHYFFLGDNYAMSSDGRFFGFVPEENIRGAPSFLIWPPGERWGIPYEANRPWITLPNLVVWGAVLILFGIWSFYRWWSLKKPTFKKIP